MPRFLRKAQPKWKDADDITSELERESKEVSTGARMELLGDETVTSTRKEYGKDENEQRMILRQEAKKGTEVTKSMLRNVVETREVAVITAEQLENQTRQLEGIYDDVQGCHAHVDGIEVTVEKLKDSKVRRLVKSPFQAVLRRSGQNKSVKKKSEKKLDKAAEERERERTAKKEKEKEKRLKALEDSSKNEPPTANTLPDEDYSFFTDEEVRKTLKEQDDHLQQVNGILSELKDMANGMNTELNYHNELVNAIDAPELTTRIRNNHRKILSVK